ncbi:MAG TPA: prenyltransferase/squalene oxidase repeat-containing protein [Myxococcaceae bacterium]|nr:prenyltransferase/squalene oxidase repeat-containing protein [Myxococcaceae bacterium]
MSPVPALFLSALTVLASSDVSSPHPSQAQQTRSEPDIARPLRWLLQAQGADGGWGQEAGAPADVATTSLSGIALLRLGATGLDPGLTEPTRRALRYVVRAVERAPAPAAYIQGEGTLPQRKLGRGIDTFLAAQFVGEALPSVPAGPERERTRAALDALVAKIQALQREDGSFSKDGWAPVLSSAFAANGLYVAKDVGATVAPGALARSEQYMLRGYDKDRKQFRTDDSAGVALYQAAGSLGAAARSGKLAEAPARAAKAHLADEAFIRGFGSYGGEEHVSYLLSTEAFARSGGEEWARWSKSIRARLASIQREDGTWRGDHCITSTSFCTAASLITLAIRPGTLPVKRG